MLLRVLAIVATCFAVGALLMLAQRRGARRSTRTAWLKYATYLLFVTAVLVIAEAGRTPFAAAVFLLLAAALLEFYGAAGLSPGARIALVLTGTLVAAAAMIGGTAALYPAAVAAALATLAVGALGQEPRSAARAAHWGVLGLIAVATPGAHLLLLAGHSQRFALFGFLFLVVCGSDAFAELVGRGWPLGRGILPASPGKTVAGLAAGVVAALAIAAALGRALDIWSGAQSLSYGLALAVAGSLGDLIASSMKRMLGIKDFGATLPGHGGVLDRFDSLIFAAAPFYWLVGG